MKKYIVLAAAAIATLASCTKNEVAAPQNNEISFKALTVKAKKTKAVINDNFYPKDAAAFKVWALYGTELYINGATCEYNSTGDIWESKPKAYWPLSGSLTFTAFSPADANALAYDAAQKKITATGLTANPQVEFLYSNTEDAKDLTSNTVNYAHLDDKTGAVGENGVPVVFQHALSQVLVYAKSGNAKTKYQVTSVVIKTLDNADLTLTESSNKYNVSWTQPTTPAASTELAYDEENLTDVTSSAFVQVSSKGWLVMPQTLAANTGANEGKQVLEIKYKMWYDNSSTATPNWVSAGELTEAKVVPLYLAADSTPGHVVDAFGAFVAGKKYILDLVISPEEIKYAPSVANWSDAEVNHYDVGTHVQ